MKNRIIKFRAFINGEMVYDGFHISAPGISWNWTDFDCQDSEAMDCPIMQFTGLIDKNGVEIFEGDVVKWDDDSDGKYWRVCEIRWVKSGFQLFGHTFYSKAPNEKKPIHFRFGQFIYEYDGALEVIGNIYQTAHSEIGKDGER